MNQYQEGSLTKKVLTVAALLVVSILTAMALIDTFQNEVVEILCLLPILYIFFMGMSDIKKLADAKQEKIKEEDKERQQLIATHKQLDVEIKEIKEEILWKRFLGSVLHNPDKTKQNTKK